MSLPLRASGALIVMLSVFSTSTVAYSDTDTLPLTGGITFGPENSGDGVSLTRASPSSIRAALEPAHESCTRNIRISIGQSIILDMGSNRGTYCKYTLKQVRTDNADFETQCGINVVGIHKRCNRELSEFPKTTTLDQRMALWRQQALSCAGSGKSAGNIVTSLSLPTGAFPTKEHPEDDLRDQRPEPCNDGDMLLFNGMLCAAGEKVGCEAAKDSQDDDGRFWRSPAIKGRATENLAEPNINSDQSLGVLLYVLQKNDRRAFRHWVQWVRKQGEPLHYCSLSGAESLKCAFRPVDCPLIILTGYAFGEQSLARSICGLVPSLGIPDPASFKPRFNQALNLYKTTLQGYRSLQGKYGGIAKILGLPNLPDPDLAPVPTEGALLDYLKRIDSEIQNIQDLLNSPDPAGFAVAYYSASLAVTSNALAAGATLPAGASSSGRHLAGTAILILQKFKMPDVTLNAAAARLSSLQPENPYFEFLARGQSPAMLKLINDQCQYGPNPGEPFFQWSWERPVSSDAAKQSMVWDCIFVVDLWQRGLISYETSVPQNLFDPMRRIAATIQNIQDAEKDIEKLIATVLDRKAAVAALADGLNQQIHYLENLPAAAAKGFGVKVNPDHTVTVTAPVGAPLPAINPQVTIGNGHVSVSIGGRKLF